MFELVQISLTIPVPQLPLGWILLWVCTGQLIVFIITLAESVEMRGTYLRWPWWHVPAVIATAAIVWPLLVWYRVKS
jgi:hypothetical protein